MDIGWLSLFYYQKEQYNLKNHKKDELYMQRLKNVLLLIAPLVHLMMFASLLFKTIALNDEDNNAAGFLLFLAVVPSLLAFIGNVQKKALWVWLAFIISLPSVYIFLAGNGLVKWFIASPILFLISAIYLQLDKKV